MPNYTIDTCSLIDGHSDADTRSILGRLIKAGRMKTPPGVLGELEVGGDDTFAWAKGLEGQLVKELTPDSAIQLGPLLDKYRRPFRDPEVPGKTYRGLIKKETSYDADPEVIALAMDHGWTVVTEEGSGIKGACKCEKVECISLQKLIDDERQKQERQLPLA